MGDKIKQIAAGKNIQQAAGNIYNDCDVYTTGSATGLMGLILKLQERIANDPPAGKFIEDLSDFMKPRPSREIVGLKKKLEAGNRKEEIDEAEYLKLKFSKKLVADELSESVQMVYAHVLAYINSSYALVVYPMIRENLDHSTVNNKIYDEIVAPIYRDIALAEIGITTEHIRGMLYYLTGNCHIKWN